MPHRYQRRDGLGEEQVGSERMIFDDEADSVHVLNGSAAFVWDCLKRPITAEAIAEAIRREYTVPEDMDVPDVVARTLDDLVSRKLISVCPPDSAPG